VELQRATIPAPVVVRRRLSRVALVVAALMLSGAAGFAAVESRRTPVTARSAASWLSRLPAVWMSRQRPHWLSRLKNGDPATQRPREDLPASAPGALKKDPLGTPHVPTRPSAASSGSKSRTPLRALPADAKPAFSPAFSASGTALFFQTGGSRDRSSAIEVASANSWPADDLRIMKVVDDGARNYHAQPSPDGRLIAFDSDRDGERGVYVAGSDGSHVRRVSGPGYAALPTWSPDGRRLAYVRAEEDRPSVWNLWIQPLDGGPVRRVTDYHVGQTWSASWFPDGRRIAYSHEDTLTILDLETGRARHFGTPVRGRLVRTPAVSPDGSRVVFQVFRSGAWILNVEDGSMECVLSDPTAEEFAWAPDGHRFAFHSRRDGQWSVYVLSGLGSAH
jgi:dipeptidyl aminopeptidase/acylaminoacyl peptidase